MGSMKFFVGVWCSDTQSLLKMLFVLFSRFRYHVTCHVWTRKLLEWSWDLGRIDWEKTPGVMNYEIICN